MENLDKKIKRWKDEAYQIQAELEKNRNKKLRRIRKKKKEERLKVEKKKKFTKNRKYGGRNSSKIS
ncbi:MAG TPA: hypothetical protein GXX41_01995 [Thermoanaerobacterium sp.]|nr:hypothetical protein [Thermoanaerobacterium sp.]